MTFYRSDGRCEICDPPTRHNPDETESPDRMAGAKDFYLVGRPSFYPERQNKWP